MQPFSFSILLHCYYCPYYSFFSAVDSSVAPYDAFSVPCDNASTPSTDAFRPIGSSVARLLSPFSTIRTCSGSFHGCTSPDAQITYTMVVTTNTANVTQNTSRHSFISDCVRAKFVD